MHPDFKHSNGTFNDFSIEQKIEKSIRYCKVPAKREKADAFDLLLSKIEKESGQSKSGAKIRRIYFTVGSVAAAACVVLFFMYSFFVVETYSGGDQFASNVVYLPDNSRVVLADDAEIKFSKLFNQRRVQLKGEAYFEVKSGEDFYVKTKNGGVLVIGTRFSVADINNTLNVHCYQGVVGVDFLKEKVKLSEGMAFKSHADVFEVQNDVSKGYPNYAIFTYQCNEVHLDELLPLVEQYFGAEIQNATNINQLFTGQFHTGNLHEVIEIVCASMQIDYSVDNENVVRLINVE